IVAPGLFLLIFIVVFPLLYMFFLAFTNYNLYNAPPRNVLDYIGFENFKALIEVDIWRNTFFSVFTWTIVWTLVATTLQIALAL
ncbi:sugar ABC transporter permease, partial [Planococcus sp. SIMBA_143]